MSKKMEDGTKICNDRIKKLQDEENEEELLEEMTLTNLTLDLEEQRNTSQSLVLANTGFEKKLEILQNQIENLGQDLEKFKNSSRKRKA